MSAPDTPARIDELAAEYDGLKSKLAAIGEKALAEALPLQARLDQLKEYFLEQVRAHGSAHAEKSKLLHGARWQVMATFSQSIAMDAAAVEKFRLALVEERRTRLMKQIFTETVRYTLAPEASAIIRGLELPKKLNALFAACTVVKDRAPTLKVEETLPALS